ncbi:MAG TPA: sugar transferase, partial [Chitinophagaceae bacterium]|nr:sugar transferase [Chitinophagaceae bacterium]
MKYHSEILLGPPAKEIRAEREIYIRDTFVKSRSIYRFVKRSFDLIFSLVFTILILSWLVPILGLLIIMESRGPVFFAQRRLGKNGRSFRCLKFRTMIMNDEANEKQASKNDYRITKLGRFLRNTNIDEFPQFINVLV